MDEKLIAPCGMNCALCIAYQAGQEGLKRRGFRSRYCPGCIPRGEGCLHMGDSCERLGKGLLRFCHECASFPCARLKALDKRYRGRYHMSMVENLQSLHHLGMAAFLDEQASRWRCPACDGFICCHKGLCLRCDLDKLRENRKYCWGENGKDGRDE